MNERKMFILSYFLGRVFFLGFGFSYLLKLTGKDAYICAILGTIFGTGIIYLYGKLKEKINLIPLKKDNSFWKYVMLFIFFLFNILIYTQIAFIFQTFADSFFLLKSPIYFISFPIPFLVFRACKKGLTTIAKVGEILMPISFILFIFAGLGLIKYFKVESFLPVLTTNTPSLLKGTLYYTFYSTAPFLLLLNVETKKNKYVLKYLFSSLTVIIMALFIIGVLGPNLIKIYRYPEYMTLKKIKLFDFIEKVENIISVAWLFDLFMTLSIAGNNLKECLPKKGLKVTFPILLFLLYLVTLLCGIYYPKELLLYEILPVLLGIFELVTLGLLFLYSKLTC